MVDNYSTDDTIQSVQSKYSEVKIVQNGKNLGYAAAVNIGAGIAESEFLLISNSDVIYHEGSIDSLIMYLNDSSAVGVCGAQQEYSDGSWEYSYGDVPGLLAAFKDLFFVSAFQRWIRKSLWNKIKVDRYPKEVDYIDGAAIATPKSLFDSLKGFDESFFFYGEEADYCFRVKLADKYVMFYPKARITHIRGGSTGPINESSLKLLADSKIKFCKKYYTRTTLKIFINFQFLHCKINLIILNILGVFIDKIKLNDKKNLYRIYVRIWNEFKESEKL